MFYFQQLFQTALNGIDSASVTGAVLGIAGSLLLLSFLYSAYEAFAAGGDVRMLAISGIKYLILGLVFANYGAVFRDVNGVFNSVGNFIYNTTGVGDLFAKWMDQLAQYWQANGNVSLWNLVTGLASGVISLALILAAFVLFPICYVIFTIFYAMYGSVLYVTGPFVLALLPARGMGQLSRTYLVNLMTFHAWGLIYAILQVLMSAVNLSSINAVLGANGVLNSFVGSSEMILLALTASVFSLSIALIPFIANRIVRGDVGSTMVTTLRAIATTASAAVGLASASITGVAQGAAAAEAAGGAAPPSVAAVTMSTSLGSGVSASLGGSAAFAALGGSSAPASMPPSPSSASPSGSADFGSAIRGAPSPAVHANTPGSLASFQPPSGRPGQYRGFNLPHAMAWYLGYSLGTAYRGVKGRD